MKIANITRDETKFLQDRFGKDVEIARHLGVTRQAIYQLRKKHGIQSLKNRAKSRNKKIISESLRTGIKKIELSRSFGLSISQVYRILKGSNDEQNKTI